MLTISILMEALTNPQKIKMSQNKLADSFNTKPSTINAWIKKGRQPQMDAATIYDGINKCRAATTSYQNDSDYVTSIINFLDITPSEKDFLNIQFNIFKNKYPSDDKCTQKFLTYLIQLALSKKDIGTTLQYEINNRKRPIIGIGIEHVIATLDDGRVLSTGANDYQQCNTHSWRDIVSVSAGWRTSVGLKSDGTCLVTGHDSVNNGEYYSWNNLISVCCGTYHFLGLKSDGTVVAHGLGGDGQCNVSDWKQIKLLAAGTRHSVGLLENGTVIACGSNSEGQCEVSSWKNVVQIVAAGDHTVALTQEGKIFFAGDKYIYNYSEWEDIVSIATGLYHIIGLKSDGTVYHTGHETSGLDSVYKWWNIKAIFAGHYTSVGVDFDGKVFITNDKHNRTHLNASTWNIYHGHPSRDDNNSPFEVARKDIIAALEKIREIGIKLSPYLHETILDSDNAKYLEDIRHLSKQTWLYREKIIQIKPLADLILRYNTAFLEFYENYFSLDNKKNVFLLSKDTYGACIEFLTVIKQILVEIRSI